MRFTKRLLVAGVSICCMVLSASCKRQPTPVPIANVNFTTNITASGLVHIGGHAYFTGAIQGLVVYRVDMTTFCAYDRACSYDWQNGGYVSINDSNCFQLICGRCGSTYNILNGYPVGKTEADAPLRQYKATLIDDVNLRIYN